MAENPSSLAATTGAEGNPGEADGFRAAPAEGAPPTLLLVDDEKGVLSSLRTLFRLHSDYRILTSVAPGEAIRIAERERIDVVISDYLMPDMTGIDFLREIRRLQPDAVRILLTGYADKDNAIRAINTAGLYHYMEKPWENDELLLVVRNGLQEASLRKQLEDKVAALERLMDTHRDLARRHDGLREELEMAARVHRSILPEALPEVGGFRFDALYQPCLDLGGDYYDLCQAGDRGILLVSDVSGHGIQAALAAMLLKSIFHDEAPGAETAVSLLQAMNRRLHRFLPRGMFAAASVVILGPGSLLELASAGLPRPHWISGPGRDVSDLPLSGIPLGLFEDNGAECFDVRRLRPDPGEVLVISTDGLGETPGPNGRLFQEGALRDALLELRASEGRAILAGLAERAERFRGASAARDDLTMLAVTRVT